MTKIARKLAELSRRAQDLEAQIARQARQDALQGEQAIRHWGNHEPVGVSQLQKQLTSLKRSCEILARHLVPEPHRRAVPSNMRRAEDVTGGRRAAAGI